MLRGRLPIRYTGCLLAAAVLVAGARDGAGQSLRGSSRSLDRQNRIARQHDYTYIDTGQRVRHFADQGWLVPIEANTDYELHAVSFPYARPEVQLFVHRLAQQYRAACGERLVVTSLTRPTTRQPRNASDRSVHPTGMALDLRYSRDRKCRSWLEGVLLELEKAGILEATLERRPVHYHVAVFPRQYSAYVGGIEERTRAQRAEVAAQEAAARTAEVRAEEAEASLREAAYTVRAGDSLWGIARSHGTTVSMLRDHNGLDGTKIYPGQVLAVPTGS